MNSSILYFKPFCVYSITFSSLFTHLNAHITKINGGM